MFLFDFVKCFMLETFVLIIVKEGDLEFNEKLDCTIYSVVI